MPQLWTSYNSYYFDSLVPGNHPLLFVAPETSRHSSQTIRTLAVLAPLLDELDIAGIIDAHIPCDDQQHLSHGKALLALLAARLSCPQALVRVQQWAGQHALDILWNIETDKLNDDRLGRSLDAFFGHRYAILTAITHRALELAQMDITRVHFDPTDVTFAGRYDHSAPRDDHFARLASDTPLSPAHIGKSYLTDRRMLHVATTSVVDEKGALPIFANLVDGNRNGHTAVAQQFELPKHSMSLPEGTSPFTVTKRTRKRAKSEARKNTGLITTTVQKTTCQIRDIPDRMNYISKLARSVESFEIST